MFRKKAEAMILMLAIVANQVSAERFFVPHTHDDLGWLLTVQQYYDEKVRKIFETVLEALEVSRLNDPPHLKKKFVYSEVGFLKMFVEEVAETRDAKIQAIKKLIESGQWEFVNGGISQSDEACPFYEDVIENYFYGLSYLRRNFKARVKSAWQLDPFGHSKTFMFLAAKFGMTHAVVGRISEAQARTFEKQKHSQLLYQFPDDSSIILHVNSGYYPPPALDCDEDCNINNFNKYSLEVQLRINEMNHRYDTFYLIGGDFNFANATSRFKFLDAVISQFDNIQYALFSDYTKSFESKMSNLPIYTDDFFVYDQNSLSNKDSWSGYFTTKPHLKFNIRFVGKLLRATKNLIAINYFHKSIEERKDILKRIVNCAEEFGVLLHHDSITGTAKLEVDNDYFKRLSKIRGDLSKFYFELSNSTSTSYSFDEVLADKEKIFVLKPDDAHSNEIAFKIFNPSLDNKNKIFNIYLPTTVSLDQYELKSGEEIIQFSWTLSVNWKYNILFFENSIEIFSWKSFSLSKKTKHSLPIVKLINAVDSNTSTIKQRFLNYINQQSASLVKTDQENNKKIMLIGQNEVIDFSTFKITINKDNLIYESKVDSNFVNEIKFLYVDSYKSGHYILNYKAGFKFEQYSELNSVVAVRTENVEGVRITGTRINLFMYQEVGANYYTIQTLVKNDDLFKKGIDVAIIVKNPKINNEGKLETDSNGFFKMKRRVGAKFENNVFPVAAQISIDDSKTGVNLQVSNDRSQGGFSLESSIGLYLQRSASTEDHKGNEEVLSVAEDIITTHHVYNFNSGDSHADDVHIEIANRQSIVFPIVLGSKSERVTQERNSPNAKMIIPKQLRLNVDFICENKILVRIQNVSHLSSAIFDAKLLLLSLFPNTELREVSFNFPFVGDGDLEWNQLNDENQLKPLEFLTILVKGNKSFKNKYEANIE